MEDLLDIPRLRYPLMALGMLSLLAGLWGGLIRIGWPPYAPQMATLHGPLMVCGFLGTVIGLERAVALGRAWSYAAPLLTGLGGVLLIAGVGSWEGPMLITAGSGILLFIFAAVLRMQAQPFAIVMAAGALSWFSGNVLWLAGTPVSTVVWWWMGFLVLTIAGERLELSRMLMHAPQVQRVFLGIVGAQAAGLVAASMAPEVGVRVIGAALVLLAAWLLRYDVARRTVRGNGLTRFIAVCLISGYVWLIAGGSLLALYGISSAGMLYDAVLHAVFVGFVFSMIFGHAPIIFPSVLGVPVAYRPSYYVHLALLHVSLVARTAGDVAGVPLLRRWGGLVNALAIVLFLLVTIYSVVSANRRTEAAGPPRGSGPHPEMDAIHSTAIQPDG
ncbi:MAG: hypothetical protein WD205_05715 [Rhodothermales bacterium]